MNRQHGRNSASPAWGDHLLAWFCAPHLLEEVQGDLHELYGKWVQQYGLRKAKLLYVIHALKFMRPYAFKRITINNPTDMFKNYLIIALRHLTKNKVFSLINISGLALSVACSLLIGLWVREELVFNRFLPDAEHIYVVYYNFIRDGETITTQSTPGPLQEAIEKDIPQVDYVTKVATWPNLLVNTVETAQPVITKERGYYATEGFFDVFQLPALDGDPKTALADPTQIIITRKLAEKFFPDDQKVLGKQLQLNNDRIYTVGAVIEDLPATSTLNFNWIVNFEFFEQEWMKSWGDNPFQTYVRLNPMASLAQTQLALKSIYPRYTDFQSAKEGRIFPILQPITDVYLYNKYENGEPVGGRIQYVWIFSIIASLILVVACINFMNMTTARSALRTKEVGVRKVFGAQRTSLIGQFLSESLLMSLLALGIALGVVNLALPTFNAIFDTQLTLDFTHPTLWFIIAGISLITGLLSGSYPALFLSGLRPTRILKGLLQGGRGRVKFRHMLVVFQFSVAIFLIAGILAIGKQVAYLRTKNLGLDRDNVVAIPLEGNWQSHRKEIFRQALLDLPTVSSAATTSALPVNIQSASGDLNWPGKDPDQRAVVYLAFVGPDFAKTMNIPLLEGRDFRPDNLADSSCYIINEAAAKMMNLQNPVGREIDFLHGNGPIIGLMKDFHSQSLHQSIGPLVLIFDDHHTKYLLIKIRSGQTQQSLADIQQLTRQFNPNYPFTYEFLDETYNNLYKSEQQVATLINYFGGLAILISCLGLFGLVTFIAEQRIKEIGIRKVLGATVTNIVVLLTKDFLILITIAFVIASPIAWYLLGKWLEDFAYRIHMQWWMFVLPGIAAFGIALLTVSFQAIRAAIANPVKSLRTE